MLTILLFAHYSILPKISTLISLVAKYGLCSNETRGGRRSGEGSDKICNSFILSHLLDLTIAHHERCLSLDIRVGRQISILEIS